MTAVRAKPARADSARAGTARSSGPVTAPVRHRAPLRARAAGPNRTRVNSSRDAVRPLPQEVAGPRLRVIPHRVISLRLLAVASAVMFFTVLFGAVTIQAQRIEGQRQIDQLDRDITAQRDSYRSLRAKVAERESPERILAEAQTLGMVEPGPVAPLVAGTPLVSDPDAPASDQGTADETLPAGSSPPGDAGGGIDR